MSKKATSDAADDMGTPLERRLSNLEKLMRSMMETFASGGAVPAKKPAGRKPTVKELRAMRQHHDGDGSGHASMPADVARALAHLPEPRRQRKERNLPPRKVYSLKDVKSAKAIQELQNLTPAATSIVVYLINHPKSTVPDLVAQLDLKRKTIENALSTLKLRGLIEIQDKH